MTSFILLTALAVGQPGLGQPESLGIGMVLTDAGQVHEGRIDQLGEFVRVITGGRTTMLRKSNVALFGESKDDAYEFLRKKKKPDNASDAAGLAEWCRKNGLMKKAVEEATLASRLAPTDRGIAKLLVEITDDAKRPTPVLRVVGKGTPTPITTVAAIAPASKPAMPGEAKPVAVAPPALELSFGKQVQPVLMNSCANCHADPNRSVAFRLTRIPDGVTVSPKSRDNVASALTQISKTNPAGSPLVIYATIAHGGRTTPPLDRATTGYKNLEAWAIAAAASLPAGSAAPIAPAISATPVVTTPGPNPTATPALLPDLITPPHPPAPIMIPMAPAIPTAPAAPVATPKAVDPFDPVEFNRPSPVKR